MNSLVLGKTISPVEVTPISSHGAWLLTQTEKLFLSSDDFPWFRNQPGKSIIHVEEPFPNHFYWPEIDVDLTVERIKHPDRFPLQHTT